MRQEISGWRGPEDFGDSPKPPSLPDGRHVLYHYTGAPGLQGIVESGALHATKALFLNDATEIMHAFRLAADCCRLLAAGNHHPVVAEALSNFVAYVSDVGNVEPNVCLVSFSEDPDALSQWRGYGGYAIGFDADRLARGLGGDWRLLKCTYDEDEQRSQLALALPEALEPYEVALSGRPPEGFGMVDVAEIDSQYLWHVIFGCVAQLAPTMKHPAFSEEREWRLVSQPIEQKNLKTRVGRHGLVQFAQWNLPRLEDGSLPIADLVVGPGHNQDRVVAGAFGLLTSQEVPGTGWSVRPSPTPFLP